MKLVGPGPLHFEFLNVFAALYKNVLGDTLRWWLGLFGRIVWWTNRVTPSQPTPRRWTTEG